MNEMSGFEVSALARASSLEADTTLTEPNSPISAPLLMGGGSVGTGQQVEDCSKLEGWQIEKSAGFSESESQGKDWLLYNQPESWGLTVQENSGEFSQKNGAKDCLTGVAFAKGNNQENSVTAPDLLQQAVRTAQEFLTDFATDPDFNEKMNLAVGRSWDVERAGALKAGWETGDFREIPQIEVRSSAEINGAFGAFANSKNTIYLSEEYLTQSTHLDAITGVLLEEIGHAVDAQINQEDASGDEGAIFSALVQGEALGELQLQALKEEDDTATITLDGQFIEIEQSTIGINQTITENLSTTDSANPNRSERFSDDYVVSGFSNLQQIQINLDSPDFDTYLELINGATNEVIKFNDDFSGNGQNSQLAFTAYPGLSYVIRATSYSPNETGNYTLTTSTLGTASSIVSTLSGQVGTVDSLGRFVQVASGPSLLDVALSNDGQLYGITNSQLYKIDPRTGSFSLIGNFGTTSFLNALEFGANNVLYGAGDSNLYTIDLNTGAASLVANLGFDFNSSGDLLFNTVNNQFFATSRGSISDSLFSVSLTGQATKIGDIGFRNIFGLSFENNNLVAFTDNRARITINPVTGAGTLDRNLTGLSGTISGAASIQPLNTASPGTPATAPGIVGFSATEYRVNEDGTVIAAVALTRTGGSDGSVSATVSFSDITATPNDYNNSPIAVSFAPGETQKIVTIPLVEDTLVEGDETINLTLSNPTGAATIGQQNTATLVIIDNDKAGTVSGQTVDIDPLQIVGGSFAFNNTTNRFEALGDFQIGLKPKGNEAYKPLIFVQQGKIEYDNKTLIVDGTIFSSIGNVAAPLFKGKFDIEVGKSITKSFEETEKLPNDLKMAGLDIDFKSLSFNRDNVGLGGRLKLPDNIGGILLDSTSVTPDTILIGENGVNLSGNVKGSIPDFEKRFSLLGILPIKEFSNFSVEYIGLEDKFKIQGKLSLVPFFKEDSKDIQAIADLSNDNLFEKKDIEVIADLSGDNFIEVKDGKADIKGSLSVNNISLGNVWGLNAKLTLDTINKDIGGDAKVIYAFGKGVPASENTGIGLGLGFKLPIPPVELNRIAGELDLADFPIFNTGVYLQEVGVELNNIAPSDPDPFDFTLNGRFTAGPELTLLSSDETFSLFDANLSGTASFERATRKFEQLKLAGKFKLISENIGDFGGDLTLNVNKNFGEFNLDGAFFKDVIKSKFGFKVNTPKFDIKAAGNGSINIPQSVPLFGGTQIGSGQLLFDFSNDGNISNDFAAGWGRLNIQKLGGVEISIVAGVKGYFDGRFERIGAKNIPETNSFIIEPGTKYVVLGADWENTGTNVPVQIKAPNGTVYNESDFAGTGKIAIVDELTDSNTKAVLVINPEPGVWDINVVNPSDLGKVQYSAIQDSVTPSIQVTEPATNITEQNVTINYNAFDSDSDAKVSLFYDTDNQGFDGILIADNLTETDGEGSFVWNTEGVAAGDYYIYAMVIDENNPPAFNYAPGQVQITEAADLSVTKIVNKNSESAANLTYTITVTNSGPNESKGVKLTDPLPEGATLVSSSLTPTQQSDNELIFDLGDLANGATKTIDITISSAVDEDVINEIPQVTARTFDPNVTNDTGFPISEGEITSPNDNGGSVALSPSNSIFNRDNLVRILSAEGTPINLLFDDEYYLAQNPDVAEAVANRTFSSGLRHFVEWGHTEKYRSFRVWQLDFDETSYLAANPDVAQAIGNDDYRFAVEHFVENGEKESRQADIQFTPLTQFEFYDDSTYATLNSDVQKALSNGKFRRRAWRHFLEYGRFEARQTSA